LVWGRAGWVRNCAGLAAGTGAASPVRVCRQAQSAKQPAPAPVWRVVEAQDPQPATDRGGRPRASVLSGGDRGRLQQAEGQLGVGQARKRLERAGERTVPFGLLCRALTLSRYALDGDPTGASERHRRTAPRYRQNRAPSFADLLAAPRRELSRVIFAHHSAATTSARKSTPAAQRSAPRRDEVTTPSPAKVERMFPIDSDGHASRPRRRPAPAAVASREGAAGTVMKKLPTWLPRRELWEVVVAGEALPPGLRRGELSS
jgi:hypothetical protein